MTYYFLLTDLRAGGSERVSVSIARILKRHGRDVRFVCLGSGEGEIKEWITPEFQLDVLNTKRTLTAYPSLLRYMEKNRDGAVMFSSREQVSLLALSAGRKLGIPVIVRLPNMPSNQLYSGVTGMKWRVIHWLNKYMLRQARLVIAQTDAMRQEAIDFYHLSEEKVVTVNNPLDKVHVLTSAEGSPNPFAPGGKNFLTVCNIAYSKGVDVLIEAFRKVREAIPEARLTVLGRTDTDYARGIVDAAKGDSQVTFAGFKANPYPYMKHCDVFVLPSRMEGFPNVLLEAMCFDKPVASTTCVPVVKKIVEQGVNGYCCDIDNATQLAEAMIGAAGLTNIHNDYNLFDEERLVQLFS